MNEETVKYTISIKDIKKAMRKLEKCHKTPEKLHMSPVMANRIIKHLHENGVSTKANNGKDYICGMEVILHDQLQPDIAFIE